MNKPQHALCLFIVAEQKVGFKIDRKGNKLLKKKIDYYVKNNNIFCIIKVTFEKKINLKLKEGMMAK